MTTLSNIAGKAPARLCKIAIGLLLILPGLWGQGPSASSDPLASPGGMASPVPVSAAGAGYWKIGSADIEAAWISPGTLDIRDQVDLQAIFSALDWQPADAFSASIQGSRVLRTVIGPDILSGPGFLLTLRSSWPGDTRVYVQDISSAGPVRFLEAYDPALPVRRLPVPGIGGLRIWITGTCLPGQALPGIGILAPPGGGKAESAGQDSGYLSAAGGWIALGAGLGITVFLLFFSGLVRKPVFAFWSAGLAWIVFWIWLRLGGGATLAAFLPQWLRNQADLVFLAPLAGFCMLGIASGLGGIRSVRSRFWTVLALVNLVFLGAACLGSGELDGSLVSTVSRTGLAFEFLAMLFSRLDGKNGASRTIPRLALVTRLSGAGGLGLMVLHLADPDSVSWLIGVLAIPGPALWLVLLASGGLVLSAGVLRQLESAETNEASLVQERGRLEELLKTALQGIEAQKAEIVRLSEVDDETGLVRKESFLSHVEREQIRFVRYGDMFSLMLVELDHLKQFRIDYTEQTVLAGRLWFFRTIREAVRKSDLVGRFGDGSVVFLMPGTTPLQAMLAAEKFRALVQESCRNAPDCPTILQGRMTVSIGVAGPRKTGQDLHRFIQELEDALTKARLAGGNRAALSPLALKDESFPGTAGA